MFEMYQREDCPACKRVRSYLEQRGLDFVSYTVTRLGSERAAVLALAGVTNAEVPVLVDGDIVLQGSETILAHLRASEPGDFFGDPRYGLTRTLVGVSYDDAIAAARDALATEGFGVLTEIDVKATMRKKLDVDFRPYIILGACNPTFALEALTAEPAIGLLLPCNVVVTVDGGGNAVVSAVDPKVMFEVLRREDIEPVALEVRKRLARVMAALPSNA